MQPNPVHPERIPNGVKDNTKIEKEKHTETQAFIEEDAGGIVEDVSFN